MGSLHWLILIPYYFVGTLAALPFLMLICRLIRLKVAINVLVGTAIALSLAAIIVPAACKWLDPRAFTGRPMLLLVLLSFLFAAVDGVLAPHLPLPLDDEIRNL
ncbi:MAG TPA: hypothetical protein VN812_14210 [Candidatus Acidoferrales bacterium]|nr:hypothetical protein [Candidatus Acidoferrales bacterium]